MATSKPKETVVTFKVDGSLLEALKGVPNRSEFIRTAILSALDSYCPLCGGTGVLTPNQKRHWDDFARHHPLCECADCHEVHLLCIQEHGRREREDGAEGSKIHHDVHRETTEEQTG